MAEDFFDERRRFLSEVVGLGERASLASTLADPAPPAGVSVCPVTVAHCSLPPLLFGAERKSNQHLRSTSVRTKVDLVDNAKVFAEFRKITKTTRTR